MQLWWHVVAITFRETAISSHLIIQEKFNFYLIFALNILTRQGPAGLFVYLRRHVVANRSHFACELFRSIFYMVPKSICDNIVLAMTCRCKKSHYRDNIIDLKKRNHFGTICCRKKVTICNDKCRHK